MNKDSDSELKGKVNGLVLGLPEEDRRRFENRLGDCLYDRDWCKKYGINYCNPDVGLARVELYIELYASKYLRKV